MAPIRVGIFGLTATSTSWAPRAHLPYLLQSPHYTIRGVCNSSPETTAAAIKSHGLPSTTKVYASAADLASDPDIDLVVVCTRVDTHHGLTKAVLLADGNNNNKKKSIFVEWPLGSNVAQAEELVELASSAVERGDGVKATTTTMIGLQARLNPAVRRIKEAVASGVVGKVLSVSVQAAEYRNTPQMAESMAYFGDWKTGGNLLSIQAVHILDAICFVHGEDLIECKPLLGNQIPYYDLLPSRHNGDPVRRRITKDTPDQILLSARFGADDGDGGGGGSTSPHAVFSFHLRGGRPFKGHPGLTWKIYGEKGEISITCEVSAIQLGFPLKVEVFDRENDSVDEVLTGEDVDVGFWKDLPVVARGVGWLYEAYALGHDYGDWQLALKWHKFVEKVFAEGGM